MALSGKLAPKATFLDRSRAPGPVRQGLSLAFLALTLVTLLAPLQAVATSDGHLEALQVQVAQTPVAAPDVTLVGLDGRPLRLPNLRGKVVFLNFWATWCVPCRTEMPVMERLHRNYGGRGLAVVAVNFGESRSEIEAFTKQLQVTFLAALDTDGTVARAFGVRGLPVTFLLDQGGRILWKAIGPREWDGPDGRAYFEQLLRAQRP